MRKDEAREKELIDKGRAYCESGQLQKALSCLNEVLESNAKSHEAFYIIGNIFHKNGEINKAIKAFSKVLELCPGHTDGAISLSILYNDIGNYQKAKEVFEKAHRQVKQCQKANTNPLASSTGITPLEDPHINKKFAHKHYELADLYMGHGRYDEALFEYNKTVALDPGNLQARIKACKTYAKKGLLAKAIEELKRLNREHPSYHPGKIALGILYYSHSKVIEAQREWEKVLNSDPKHPEAKMYLKMSESATETVLTSSP